ncbi:MAG: thiamine pyrophosphate-binding protein [Gammaproteobacteria bacterium]|nr:thiamine pyrophosphate-binding protein [Gammaproteobacteria bacterium]
MTEDHHPHAEWSGVIFDILRGAGVQLFTYVPDAGNDRLIALAQAHNDTRAVLLTSEEEGVAICAGADLLGKRAILCMQSSGLGNCPNFLSLAKGGRFPLLMMITMRGDYGEQNPWQYPMGAAVEPLLQTMGVLIFKVQGRDDLKKATMAALDASGNGAQSAAIVLGQKFLGAKGF